MTPLPSIHIDEPFYPLVPDQIKKGLDLFENKSSVHIHCLKTVDSTNQYLKTYPLDKDTHLCCAEEQTAGRGRLGRAWHSPFGENIYLSLRYPLSQAPSDMPGLSLLVSLCVIKALSPWGIHEELQVKWPNDVMWKKKKMAGNLVELLTSSSSGNHLILGIGLNVNAQNNQSVEISQPWSSLSMKTGQYFNRNLLISAITTECLRTIRKIPKDWSQEWNQYDALYQQRIRLRHNNQTIEGTALGINHHGELMIRDEDSGQITCFRSGETSLTQA